MHLAALMHSNHVICIVGVSRSTGQDFVKGGGHPKNPETIIMVYTLKKTPKVCHKVQTLSTHQLNVGRNGKTVHD